MANSAWVSTLDESKAESKSDEEVIRVTKFLVENHHTSPFESVTLSFWFKMSGFNDSEEESASFVEMAPFLGSPFVKRSELVLTGGTQNIVLTTDLFNFIKIAKKDYSGISYRDTKFWKLFEAQDSLLASIVDLFEIPPEYSGGIPDVSEQLGPNGITVELVTLHDAGAECKEHTRATWRICCPLSIAVQILRHRSGSFNMASSRYRTANLDIVEMYDDVKKIWDTVSYGAVSVAIEFEDFLNSKQSDVMKSYSWAMKAAKSAKEAKTISNDEYKRFREFARYILPEGRMTELYVSFYLPDFLHYLQLRDSRHAQVEHAHVAQLMKKTFNEKSSTKII